jgi:hypothetical protein
MSTFLLKQISHQQPVSSTFLLKNQHEGGRFDEQLYLIVHRKDKEGSKPLRHHQHVTRAGLKIAKQITDPFSEC